MSDPYQLSKTLLSSILSQKEEARKERARMSFKEKYQSVIRMQKRSNELMAHRGVSRVVWPEWID